MNIGNSQMQAITIFDAMTGINEGRFVIPAFQRSFVWNINQIEKLWDSILIGFPISTFLFWHINNQNIAENTNFRLFPSKYFFNDKRESKQEIYKPSRMDFDYMDTAILDGQQRLTALYLSLYGDILACNKNARNNDATICELLIELDKTKLEDVYDQDNNSYNTKRYGITITKKIAAKSATQFKIRDILADKFRDDATREEAIENAVSAVSIDSKEYAKNILRQLHSKIYVEKTIRYLELTDTKQEDALEVFVRFNSAGKPLKKHEITMAVLEAYWPGCKEEFDSVLTGEYSGFGYDFIVRTALMLFATDVTKSNIDPQTAASLKRNWGQLKDALRNVKDLLENFDIKVSRFASGWNILLPVIYAMYGNRINQTDAAAQKGIFTYIVRAVLFKYFSFGTTAKLAKLKDHLNNHDKLFSADWLDGIPDFEVNPFKVNLILDSEKSDRISGETLFYLGRSWISSKFDYELDHLHPYAEFDRSIPGITPEQLSEMVKLRNGLPNLQLLEGRKNPSKSDESLESYYNDKTPEQQKIFIERAMIPNPDECSMKLRNFIEFYNKRKEILRSKITALLNGEI